MCPVRCGRPILSKQSTPSLLLLVLLVLTMLFACERGASKARTSTTSSSAPSTEQATGPAGLPDRQALQDQASKALRTGDSDTYLGLMPTFDQLLEHCPDRVNKPSRLQRARERYEKKRRTNIERVADCGDRVDWSKARLVAREGGIPSGPVRGCDPKKFQEHEDLLLYYNVGAEVWQLTLDSPLVLDGRWFLGGRTRCRKVQRPADPRSLAAQVLRQLKAGEDTDALTLQRKGYRLNCPDLSKAKIEAIAPRRPSDQEKTQLQSQREACRTLLATATITDESLRLEGGDLAEAIEGCQGRLHRLSPILISFKDHPEQVLLQAVSVKGEGLSAHLLTAPARCDPAQIKALRKTSAHHDRLPNRVPREAP